MKHSVMLLVAAIFAMLGACERRSATVDCSEEWQQQVEYIVGRGDGQGHGPDLGSEEWKSVVEFKLGIRGSGEVPDRDAEAWCVYIQSLIDRG